MVFWSYYLRPGQGQTSHDRCLLARAPRHGVRSLLTCEAGKSRREYAPVGPSNLRACTLVVWQREPTPFGKDTPKKTTFGGIVTVARATPPSDLRPCVSSLLTSEASKSRSEDAPVRNSNL
jgi:hypothetical protein